MRAAPSHLCAPSSIVKCASHTTRTVRNPVIWDRVSSVEWTYLLWRAEAILNRGAMLSTRLLHLIEDHWQTISSSVIQEIRNDPALRRIRALPETELREIGRTILRNLGHWLTAPKRDQEIIAGQY